MAGTFPDMVPVLTDGDITLRPHLLSDVDEVVVQCVDPDSVRWTTVPTPYGRADAESFVTTRVPEGWHTRKDLNFAIEATHPDGRRKFSGSIALRPMEEGIAELAFGLHPAVRGQGVCSRAVKSRSVSKQFTPVAATSARASFRLAGPSSTRSRYPWSQVARTATTSSRLRADDGTYQARTAVNSAPVWSTQVIAMADQVSRPSPRSTRNLVSPSVRDSSSLPRA